MIIPPINSTGKFTFSTPYDTILDSNKEYTVISIRSLLELHNSSEEPCDNIYKAVGLTEDDFNEDLNSNVPIIVFGNGGNYTFVPADRIVSMPTINGISYQEVILAISLGSLPVGYNIDLAKSTIIDDIYDTLGIDSTVAEVPSSAVTLVTDIKHKEYMLLLANRKTVTKSYRTRYLEELERNNKLTLLLEELETCIKNKLP